MYVTGWSVGLRIGYDYATIKYTSAGDSLWVRWYDGPGNSLDGATALAVDGSGNVYVTGYSYGPGTDYDYATIKYTSAGDSLWVRRYNGPGNYYDYATALAVDGSGNVYVTGYSQGGNGDIYTTIKYTETPVSVEERVLGIPLGYKLEQNYPNPFNPVTVIRYSLPVRSRVTLKFYNMLGQEVAVLVDGEKPAGSYQARFEAGKLSSGVYFYRLSVRTPSGRANHFVETKKLLLLR